MNPTIRTLLIVFLVLFALGALGGGHFGLYPAAYAGYGYGGGGILLLLLILLLCGVI